MVNLLLCLTIGTFRKLNLNYMTNEAINAATNDAAEKTSWAKPDEATLITTNALGGRNYVHTYYQKDWNTCGQASIGAILDFYNKNPYNLPRLSPPDPGDDKKHFDDNQLIAAIKKDFPPDVIGTSPMRIRDALQHYKFKAFCGFSGLASAGWEKCWQQVQTWVNAGHPAICCVDTGKLGGDNFGAHWLIVYRIETDKVWVANYPKMTKIAIPLFLEAWHTWFLNTPFNHAYIVSQP